jgi:hypothetical protein
MSASTADLDPSPKEHICAAGLAGKDYFTVREAAAYACTSYSHWRARIQPEFPAGEFMGKLIYRRIDVQRFIEQRAHWPQAPAAARMSHPKPRSKRVQQ